jgi:RNA polymerase sigma factor (sigma-70 family)
MATSVLNPVIGQLRKAVLVRDGAGLTDGQLLESFVRQRDEAAFEVLVRRHGPMVLGVCRRVLRNHHDAEDAFQATFLVLARKAGSLLPRGMVAHWLYGVAHRTALKARGVIARRRVRERHVAEMPEPEAAGPDTCGGDLRPLLDRELSGLPDKYRVPIVLCDLEGKAGKEAARQLGWPEGTVASRLSRGRVLLARRLTRHGLAFSGGSLAAVLSREAASAKVPASLVTPTVRAAGCLAAGQALTTGLVSAEVAALTEGVLKAMFLTKLKSGMALFLALGVLGAGLGVTLTCVGGTAGPATGAGVAAPGSDKDRLQGTWQQVSAEGKEGKVADEFVKENTLVIKGDTLTVVWEKQGKKGSYELTFKLDETRTPKAVDEALVKPEKGDKPYLGIYSLEGETLKFCFSDPGEKRPTEFTAKPGSGWTLTVFKRKQPSPAQPAQAKTQGPTTNETNDKKPPDQNQAKQALDMILKGFQAYQDSKGKKPADQDLANFLWEMMEKSYRPPDGKKSGPADKEALGQYKEAFLKAFQLASKIAGARAQARAKIRPEDEAAFDACGPAFVEAYERAKTLKKALEEQRASGGKESGRAIAALDAFLMAGKDFEQAVKLRAKTRAVEQAKREIENALGKVKETANDRRTELEALEEIEKAVQEIKKKVQEREDGK